MEVLSNLGLNQKRYNLTRSSDGAELELLFWFWSFQVYTSGTFPCTQSLIIYGTAGVVVLCTGVFQEVLLVGWKLSIVGNEVENEKYPKCEKFSCCEPSHLGCSRSSLGSSIRVKFLKFYFINVFCYFHCLVLLIGTIVFWFTSIDLLF